MSGQEYNKVKARNNMEVSKHAEVESGPVAPSERPKLQGVVGVAPKKVKRSLLSRLITGIVGPEGLSGLGNHIAEDVVRPAIKNIIWDSATSGLSRALFGNRGFQGNRNPYVDNRPRNNYQRHYDSQSPASNRSYGREPVAEPRNNVITNVSRYDIDDYVIVDRIDAAHVLTSLTEYADRYGSVSVAEYYDLIKIPSEYIDNNRGWRYDTITAARIVPARGGGFIVKFPPVEAL